MEGVILFADDHIHSSERPEHALFKSLRKDLPVLGVHSLELASAAIGSIGSFGALILDWQYSPEEDFADIAAEVGEQHAAIAPGAQIEDAAYKFLLDNNFYSLIYIFSEKDIEETHGEALKQKFGNRIKFKRKDETFTIERAQEFKQTILEDIDQWREQNKNLSVPITWSASINEAVQHIFKDLAEADKDWIKEIYQLGEVDGVDPQVFVIELLQLLLSEELVQNKTLIDAIHQEGSQAVGQPADIESKKHSLAKLFSRLIFSELKEDAPLNTGDICQLADNMYGVLVTPECDILAINGNDEYAFDFLQFSATSLEELLASNSGVRSNKKGAFNQVFPRYHFFPSVPFLSDNLKTGCVIDFAIGSRKIKSSDLRVLMNDFPRKYKINSPFIQQLRQRYLAHLGKVGPARIHDLVRQWNIG